MSEIRAVTHGFDDLPDDFRAVYDYWHRLRGSAPGPQWSQFDLMEIPARLLPWTVVVDLNEASGEFIYRYFGSGFARLHEVDLSWKTPAGHSSKELGDYITAEFRRTCAESEPNFTSYRFRGIDGDVRLFQEVLRLPLCDDGEKVSGVVSVTHFDIEMFERSELLRNVLTGS